MSPMEKAQRDDEWYLDPANIACLYEWLVDNGELDTTDKAAVRYFISKPWKWADEWKQMLRDEEGSNG